MLGECQQRRTVDAQRPAANTAGRRLIHRESPLQARANNGHGWSGSLMCHPGVKHWTGGQRSTECKQILDLMKPPSKVINELSRSPKPRT